MNIKNRTLRKAVRLLMKRQLTRCIQLLESKISLFLDNADYFYLLGRCYFTIGDSENADLYLSRGLENEPNHEDIQLMQACFAVREQDTYRAISIWLKLEDAGCRRPCLRYGLDQIRRINDSEELYNFTHSSKFIKLLPSLPGILYYRTLHRLWRLLLMVLLVSIFWFSYTVGTPRLQKWYREWRMQREQSENISLVELENSEYLAFDKKDTLFLFDQDQLRDLTSKIRKNYDLYRDNLVQHDINKIFYSNASDKVKAKFHIIEGLLGGQQEIYNLKNNFTFLEVRRNPQLYENCFVRWEGRPTNIYIEPGGGLRFTLLVGYTDGTVLEGQVPVEMNDLVSLSVDLTITIFGRIKIANFDTPQKEQKITNKNLEKIKENQRKGEIATINNQATFYIEAKTLARS